MTTARDVIAKAISPDWFGPTFDGRHVLDNYPDQHLGYQRHAYERADAVIAAILADESVRLELAALLNPWRPTIPKGFVLVPIEATPVMMNAGVEAAGEAVKPSWPGAGCPGFVQIRAAWAAMLETVPAPPSEDK